MANQAVTISVNANTTSALKAIEGITNKQYTINLQANAQPLGKITGQLSEFNKSLDAANARVVAFGASAGAVMVVKNAFDSLISSTINVQKSLKDIQVVIDASDSAMNKFGSSLFSIAKNTGQSFSEVASAATELARQGLSMEETLKRTNEALILSRLSGMSAAQSVDTLTASVNSFANQAISATEIVNKFANVDAAFAVSSKDLAEGISRVGASASQAGVSIDELIALITSAQQVTARGGAVIGNSFKTIFTRLERGKTQDLLETIGISTKDSEGRLKSSIQMLKDLANVYSSLDQGQQAEVAEKVGGVFQINILKAALGDLGKEYSIYSGALKTSQSATDEAIKRNEELNQTYAAQINRLKENAAQLAASAGQKILGPSMSRVIGTGNSILEGLNNADTASVGTKLGEGLLNGIGQVLAGPGLVLLGGVLIKLLGDFTKFATGSTKELLGLNAASKEQAAIQASITAMLQKDPEILAQITSQGKTQVDQAKILLGIYEQQTLAMQAQASLASQLAKQLYTGGVRMGAQGVPVTKTAAGYIPNFVNSEFKQEESNAKMLGAKNPKAKWGQGTIGGKPFIMNSEETEIPNFGKNGDSAVIPNYSRGHIPNFAEESRLMQNIAARKAKLEQQNAGKGGYKAKGTAEKNVKPDMGVVDMGKFSDQFGVVFAGGAPRKVFEQSFSKIAQLKNIATGTATVTLNKSKSLFPVDSNTQDAGEKLFNTKIDQYLSSGLLGLVNDIGKEIGLVQPIGSLNASQVLTQAVKGTIFEKSLGIAASNGKSLRVGDTDDQSSFDYRPIDAYPLLKELINVTDAVEAKISSDSATNIPGKIFNTGDKKATSVLNKIQKDALIAKEKKAQEAALNSGGKYSGYIPNFAAAMQESIGREIGAGVPQDDIYIKRYGQLASPDNPQGYGVFNTRDEGTVSSEKRAMSNRGYATGYIPNFAEGDSGGVGLGGAAIAANLAMAFALMRTSSTEASDALKASADKSVMAHKEQVKALEQEIVAAKESAAAILNNIRSEDQMISVLSRRTSLVEAERVEMESLTASMRKNQAALAQAENNIEKFNAKLSVLSKMAPGQSPSVGQSLKAKGKDFVMGGGLTNLAMFAPMITEQIAAMMPKNTDREAARANVVTGIGKIGASAGTGAMLGSMIAPGIGTAIGAAAGLAIGAFNEVPGIINGFKSRMLELTKANNEAKDGLNNFNSASQLLLESIQTYSDAVNSGTANEKTLQKAREAYEKALLQFEPQDIKDIQQAFLEGGMPKAKEVIESKRSGRQQNLQSTDLAKSLEELLAKTTKVSSVPVAQPMGITGSYSAAVSTVPMDQVGKLDESAKKSIDLVLGSLLQGKQGQDALDLISQFGMQNIGEAKSSKEIEAALTRAMQVTRGTETLAKSDTAIIERFGQIIEKSQNPKEFANQIGQAIAGKEKVATEKAKSLEEGKKLEQQFAEMKNKLSPVNKALALFKDSISSAMNKMKASTANVFEEERFGYQFARSRKVSSAEAIGEMGLSQVARNLSIQNDLESTVGAAEFNAQSNIKQQIADVLTSNIQNLIPSKNPQAETSPQALTAELGKQITTLNNITGQGTTGGVVADMQQTIKEAMSLPKTQMKTAFGEQNIYDTDAIIKAVQGSPNFVKQYGGANKEEAMRASEKLRTTIENENKNIIESQRELAAKAAQQLDQLIKIQLQQLQTFGGGIEEVLSDLGPQAGKQVEKAAIGYAQVQSNPFATDLQKGREAFQTGKAINKMMGGLPVIGEDSQIYKDTTKGIADGLSKDWEAQKSGLLRTQGGEEMVGKMEQKTMQLTGAKDMKGAFAEIAKYQAMKALNLDTSDTAVAKGMMAKRLESAKTIMGQTPEGQAALKAFEGAQKITDDPAAQATMALQASMEALIGKTNTLLGERLNAAMPISPFTAMGSQIKENYGLPGPALGVGVQGQGEVKESAFRAMHEFKVGIDLAESPAGGPSMQGLSDQLNAAVQQAVDPILQDFYNELNKLKFQMNNDGQQPPPTETNAE